MGMVLVSPPPQRNAVSSVHHKRFVMEVVRMGGKEVIYSDGSQAPKTEGGLPARLFRNGFSPQKYEEQAGMPAPHSPSTSGCLRAITNLL